MIRPRLIVLALAAVLLCGSVDAAWFDDYAAGIAAAKRGEWRTVVEKMNASLAAKPNEGRERTYGNVFIQYRPYYYRGVAYFELGDFNRAISDLERTQGQGELSLGSPESFIRRATPTPEPVRPPTPVPTTPTTPTPGPVVTPTPATPIPGPVVTPLPGPVITPVPGPIGDTTSVREARMRAQTLLSQAEDRRALAQQARADSLARSEFTSGMQHLTRARSLGATANSLAQWNAAANEAEAARLNFERAWNRANAPVEDLLAETRRRVRSALEAYFDGRFREAASQFERLTAEQGNNALIWAFYGASLYSSWYVNGQIDAALHSEAERAFRRAKALRLTQLDPSYFSPRIRRFYTSIR
jgi:hypothetical protein